MQKGFTLLELLIVIAILAILSTLVVLVLDPAETIRKARDVQRISDLSTLKTAIVLFIGEKGGGAAIAGPGGECADGDRCECRSEWAGCPGGAPCACVSTSDSVNTGYNPTITDHESVEIKYGWLPIDFTLMGGGSPISILPVDAVNTIDFYYRYNTDGVDFIFDCELESKYYTESVKLQKTDGGSCDNSYEVGTNLAMFDGYCRP